MGRGVLTFSISSAIALASYTPTQIGSTVSPESLRITIGVLVTGSSISPRIFISTSIATPCVFTITTSGRLHHVTQQAVWKCRSDLYRHITALLKAAVRRCGEVQCLVLGCPADPLTTRFVLSFNHYFKLLAYMIVISTLLDASLFLQQHCETA